MSLLLEYFQIPFLPKDALLSRLPCLSKICSEIKVFLEIRLFLLLSILFCKLYLKNISNCRQVLSNPSSYQLHSSRNKENRCRLYLKLQIFQGTKVLYCSSPKTFYLNFYLGYYCLFYFFCSFPKTLSGHILQVLFYVEILILFFQVLAENYAIQFYYQPMLNYHSIL